MPASQSHGLEFEKIVKKICCSNPNFKNSATAVHDIPKEYNTLEPEYNVSVKTTGNNIVCCGDPRRIFNYEDDNIMIIIMYKQEGKSKIPKQVVELYFNNEMKEILFGDTEYYEIDELDTFIKNVPHGKISTEDRELVRHMANTLSSRGYMTYNPKMDSKRQRRLQCSIKDLPRFCKKFPQVVKSISKKCMLNNQKINPIKSGKRKFRD
jgi:hypothetical protein